MLEEGTPKLKSLRGGLELMASPEQLFGLALHARLLEGLRVRIGRFEARSFRELEAALARITWRTWVGAEQPVRARVTCKKSKLMHSDAVGERVIRAASSIAQGPRPDEDVAAIVHLRIVKDRVTVSLEAGGLPLHKRGWKTQVGEAPLRETHAAAIVRLAELAPDQPVWDPFCGSGTIVLEARRAPPRRSWSFERWPVHDAEAFAAVPRSEADPRRVLGSDQDEGAVARARYNARAAGVEVELEASDFDAIAGSVAPGSAVLTNVPWGQRLPGGASLERTWRRFGDGLASRPDLDPVVVLAPPHRFARATGLPWDVLAELRAGGTPVQILRLRRGAAGS